MQMENSPNYEARVRCSVQQFSPVDEGKEVEDMIAIIENLCVCSVCSSKGCHEAFYDVMCVHSIIVHNSRHEPSLALIHIHNKHSH